MPQINVDWHNKRYDVIIDGQRCKFKSKFEYRWALYLQQLVELDVIQSWEYEPKRFMFEEIKEGTRGYTPDFRVCYAPLVLTNGIDAIEDGEVAWHETKVHLIAKDITKYHRMQIYYPDEKLILVMDRRKGRQAKHKQVNLLEAAAKYVHRIIFANEISLFRQIKVN